MNKKNIIIAAIIVVLLAALASYYFLYDRNDSPQLTEEARQVEQEEMQQEQPEESEPEQKEEVDEQEEQKKEKEQEQEDKQEEEEAVKEEAKVKEIVMAGEYKYREEMRDPFFEIKKESDDQAQDEEQDDKKEKIEVVADPQLTIEDLKVPFRLDGIIEQSSQSIAIVATSDGSRFIRKSESIGEYDVLNVGDERIKINYQNLTFYMEIGGALVEK